MARTNNVLIYRLGVEDSWRNERRNDKICRITKHSLSGGLHSNAKRTGEGLLLVSVCLGAAGKNSDLRKCQLWSDSSVLFRI